MKLRPQATKAKRADFLPIPSLLASHLRESRPVDANATDAVFPRVPKFETWVADLKDAGIEYKAADNSILGFHSLRVTYITNLQKAGLPVSTVMELARHTDYRITKESYTDPRMLDTFGAVAALPTYEDPKTTEALGLRSGTDDCLVMAKHDSNDCTYPCTQTEGATLQVGSIPCSVGESKRLRVRGRNPSKKHGKTRLFSQFSGVKMKAGESGLALEETTPSSNMSLVRNRDFFDVSFAQANSTNRVQGGGNRNRLRKRGKTAF